MSKVKEFGGLKDKPLQVKPLYDYVYVTANKQKIAESESGIILPDSAQQQMYLPNQIVMAKGDNADQVEVGDEVMLNVEHFLEIYKDTRKDQEVKEGMRVKLPLEEINGVEYMYVSQRNIKYKAVK